MSTLHGITLRILLANEIIRKIVERRMSKNTEMISTRVDPEVRAVIEKAAAEERRPVGNLVRCILADWVNWRAGAQAAQQGAPR